MKDSLRLFPAEEGPVKMAAGEVQSHMAAEKEKPMSQKPRTEVEMCKMLCKKTGARGGREVNSKRMRSSLMINNNDNG